MTRQNSRSLTTNRYEFLIICKKIHLKYVGLVHRRQERREETQVRGTVSKLLTLPPATPVSAACRPAR